MFNVKYVSSESSDEEKSKSRDLEEEKISQKDLETNFQPNIIRNESSDDEIQEMSDKEEQIITKQRKEPKRKKTLTSQNSGSFQKDQPEIEEIVKMFAHDLQQSIRQRFKSKSSLNRTNKKIPMDVQKLLGEANNLYAFKQFNEAINLYMQVITKMPEHADTYKTISTIYAEMGDLEKSLNFGIMGAFLIKTDVEYWRSCAKVAFMLRRFRQAIYCLNRAIKQTSPLKEEEILSMKFEKLSIYKMSGDYSSAVRALEKLRSQFSNDLEKRHKITIALAQTLAEQGQTQRSFEVLEQEILKMDDQEKKIELILLLSDIAIAKKEYQQILNIGVHLEKIIFEKSDIAEMKVKMFSIFCNISIAKISLEQELDLNDIKESLNQFNKEQILNNIENYQRVANSIFSLANRLDQNPQDLKKAILLHQYFYDVCYQIDQPNILQRIAKLYLKIGDKKEAIQKLEQAFEKCPPIQNGQIRIELGQLYNAIGESQKALEMFQNPLPQNRIIQQQPSQQLPKKRKRLSKDKNQEQIILSSESEKDEIPFSDADQLYDQIMMQDRIIDDQSRESISDEEEINYFQGFSQYPQPLQYTENNLATDDKEFLLKRSQKLQKRRKRNDQLDLTVSQTQIDDLKNNLENFNVQQLILQFEKAKLHIQLFQYSDFLTTIYDSLLTVMINFQKKQQLQEYLLKQGLQNSKSDKESFFIKQNEHARESETSVIQRISHQVKSQIIEQLEKLPSILTHIKSDEIFAMCMEALKQLIDQSQYQQSCRLVDMMNQVEILQALIEENLDNKKVFYKSSAFVYYMTQLYNKAYKALRKISTENDKLNWALLGCIINKHEDPTFCRSYMKRLLQKQEANPFIVMILGNNYYQKQQSELAIPHFWSLFKQMNSENTPILSLCLAIINLIQAYSRTNEQKEQSIKRALGFLVKYCQTSEDQFEVQYNIARVVHLMGLNALAIDYYQYLIDKDPQTLNNNQKEIQIRAIFNMTQLMKGSGINTGITLNEGQKLDKNKIFSMRKAHQLLTTRIII